MGQATIGECALVPPANTSSAGPSPEPSNSMLCCSCALNPTFIPHQLMWSTLQQGGESRWMDSDMQLDSHWMWTFYLVCCLQLSFLTFGWCRISRNICSSSPTYVTGRLDPARYCLPVLVPPLPWSWAMQTTPCLHPLKPDAGRPGKDPPFPKCFAYLLMGRLPTHVPTPAQPRSICCPWRTLPLPSCLALTGMRPWGQPHRYCARTHAASKCHPATMCFPSHPTHAFDIPACRDQFASPGDTRGGLLKSLELSSPGSGGE